jgi:hypothetical protein
MIVDVVIGKDASFLSDGLNVAYQTPSSKR